MAVNYTADPKASLDWLLNPETPLSEIDTAAAEGAVGMGGMAGSPFAANNRLRLRDSERINRLQIGQNLLNPYLQRESNERISNNQIQAQAASDAMRESGLDRRLSAEGQQRLQLAILNGDQQAQDRLLTEAGLTSRQSSSIAAGLQEATMRNQTQLLTSLFPYVLGGKGGAGGRGGNGGSGSGSGVGDWSSPRPGDMTTDFGSGNSIVGWRPPQDVTATAGRATGGAGGVGGTGLSGKLGSTLDSILRSYGLTS